MKIPFSLVTTCRNEMRSFARWQQNILAQTRSPAEIVIVDAFSNDGTAEALQAWAATDSRVKFIQEKGAAAHGRNFAIANASHEHILSTDMGVRLAEVWCEELITPFERDNEIEVVVGNTCIDFETVKSAVARAEYYMEANGGEPVLGPGSVPGNRSVAYTRKVWRELGGLPEDLTFYADDSVFGRQIVQAGYKTAYAPKAMTYWGRPNTLKQFWKEQWNYGRGDGEAAIKVPFAFRWYKKKYIPKFLVPLLTGFRFLQIRCHPVTLYRVITYGGIKSFLVLPFLTFGQGYHYGKGHLIGDERGSIECQACRMRLNSNTPCQSIG